jgi:hypothetical protein
MRAFADRSYKQKWGALNSWKAYCQSFDSGNLQHSLEEMQAVIEGLEKKLQAKDDEMTMLQEQIDLMWGEKKKVAFKTMSKMINAKQTAAWGTWVTFVKELNRNEAVLKK